MILAALSAPVQALKAPLFSVTLAWDPSPSIEVVGYRLYYGAASRNYSRSLVVGNVTTATVPGLAAGATYFFAVTAYDASGLESDFSNEISFTPGPPTPSVQIRVAPEGQVILTVTGRSGGTYDILATEAFTSWTVIGTATMGAGGSLEFIDLDAASYPARFYRTQETPRSDPPQAGATIAMPAP